MLWCRELSRAHTGRSYWIFHSPVCNWNNAWKDKRRYSNPSRDITLVTKHVNKVNKVLKNIPVKNLSELKHVARTRASLVCEKVGVKIDHAINKKQPFWKWRIQKGIVILRKALSKIIDDWLKGRWKNGSAKLKCELKKKHKLKAKVFNSVIEERKQRISAKTLKFKRFKSKVEQCQQIITF